MNRSIGAMPSVNISPSPNTTVSHHTHANNSRTHPPLLQARKGVGEIKRYFNAAREMVKEDHLGGPKARIVMEFD
ncbi:hypothetical protein CEXT_426971 [Caerostris extrusa]|uniref:Uncharacterized protein n=1 Tax=Caerostris extrusa TaxID=172846 RepID=A0AAV4NXI1_CAEEX|nr:hypothetical protein CEXT_426971 [Caerostris extrusa]